MSVFRLNPFSIHASCMEDGGGEGVKWEDVVEPGPLEEEPVLLEYQLEGWAVDMDMDMDIEDLEFECEEEEKDGDLLTPDSAGSWDGYNPCAWQHPLNTVLSSEEDAYTLTSPVGTDASGSGSGFGEFEYCETSRTSFFLTSGFFLLQVG